jgi:translation elongation factor 2 (EF-2/EF-G)
MEKFFEQGSLSEDEMRSGLSAGIRNRQLSQYSAYQQNVILEQNA